MIGKRLTDLTVHSAVDLADLLYVVADPGGTPVSHKVTVQDIVDLVPDDTLDGSTIYGIPATGDYLVYNEVSVTYGDEVSSPQATLPAHTWVYAPTLNTYVWTLNRPITVNQFFWGSGENKNGTDIFTFRVLSEDELTTYYTWTTSSTGGTGWRPASIDLLGLELAAGVYHVKLGNVGTFLYHQEGYTYPQVTDDMTIVDPDDVDGTCLWPWYVDYLPGTPVSRLEWTPIVESLDDLSDVDMSSVAPVSGDIPQFDGSNWVPATLSSDDLTDFDMSSVAPVSGDVPRYDGSNWVPQAWPDPVVSFDDLTDIDMTTVAPMYRQAPLYDTDSATWVPVNVAHFDGVPSEGDMVVWGAAGAGTETYLGTYVYTQANASVMIVPIEVIKPLWVNGITFSGWGHLTYRGNILDYDTEVILASTPYAVGTNPVGSRRDFATPYFLAPGMYKIQIQSSTTAFDLNMTVAAPIVSDDLIIATTGDTDSYPFRLHYGLHSYGTGTLVPAELDSLADVDMSSVAPVSGDLATFDGTNWVPEDLATLLDNVGIGQAARVYNTAAQPIATGVWDILEFDTERYDTGGFFDSGVHVSRIYAPATGLYRIGCSVAWEAPASSGLGATRHVGIKLNGLTYIAFDEGKMDVDPGRTLQSLFTEYALTAGDYIEIWVYQNTGADLDVLNEPAYGNEAWISRFA